MKTKLSSTAARKYLSDFYKKDSQPLSNVKPKDDVNSISWWLSSKRAEKPTSDRKIAAISCYLHITANSTSDSNLSEFPGLFEFSSGAQLRPDKGLIKALVETGMIVPFSRNNELWFRLTDNGKSIFNFDESLS